jgi:hypothetical protein
MMKRIAALAAVMIGLLALPAAAMASTTGSGPGPGTTVSALPGGCHIRVYGAHRHPKRQVVARLKLKHAKRGKIACARLRQFPLPAKQCLPQTLTFSVASGSSTMTEVSGPQLAPAEEFTSDGTTYTIMTVNPGASQFTAFVNNFLFTNQGAAITNATGVLACSG